MHLLIQVPFNTGEIYYWVLSYSRLRLLYVKMKKMLFTIKAKVPQNYKDNYTLKEYISFKRDPRAVSLIHIRTRQHNLFQKN